MNRRRMSAIDRANRHAAMRYSTIVLATAAFLLSANADAVAQQQSGVIRDMETGEAIEGARIVQVMGEESSDAVFSAADGSFRIRLSGGAPWELLVQRMGYAQRRVMLDGETLEGAAITLMRDAVRLGALEVAAPRDRLDFRIGAYRVTEAGITHPVFSPGHCRYFVLDGVVVRDPRLFLPENRVFDPARRLLQGFLVMRIVDVPLPGVDQRLQDEAAPCLPSIIVRSRAAG
jgi:hypothetical protein